MKPFKYHLLIAATAMANTAFAQVPVALFQSWNTSGCVPLTVVFVDSSFNTPTSWNWDFGDGDNSTLQNPQHTYVSPGTFTVSLTATNGNGSDTYTAVNLVTASISPVVNAGPDQVVCNGGNATLSGTVTGGGGTGMWATTGTGVFSPNDSALSAAYLPSALDTALGSVYILLISTNNGTCLADTDSLTLAFAKSTLSLVTDSVAASCAGVCDGMAIAFASGGVLPYTYVWSNAAMTDSITNLCTGTYYVTVSDSSGCAVSSGSTVSAPVAINTNTAASGESCFGSCDGVLMAFISGGTSPYTLLWNDPAAQTDSFAWGLCAGVYTVLVTDASGCTDSAADVVSSPSQLAVSTSQSGASCGNCDGSATVVTSGGTPPYTYTWDDPMLQTTFSAIALCQGTYTVLVTDNSGCSNSASVNITGLSSLVFNMTIADAGCSACDGSAIPAPSNGIPPYTYLWSDSTTGTSLTNLCVGAYSLQITDSAGCVADTSFSIANLGGLTAYVSGTSDVSCNGGADGSATVSAAGGFPPYTFLWDDISVQTTATAGSLYAGAYSCIIADSLGCTTSVVATLFEPSALLPNISATDEGCNGPGTGTATAAATGGTPPYTLLWSTGDSAQNLTGLSAGIYTVTISDNNGCLANDSAVILIDTNGVILNVSTYLPNYCGGYGYAYYSTTGGAPLYTYQWTPQPYYVSGWSHYAVMEPGIYSLSVSEATGCVDTVSVVVPSLCAPNMVHGKVFDDFNSNCILDSNDYGLNSWVVRADPGPVFANTSSDGSYTMFLDSGSYTISLINNDPGFRTQVCPASPGTYSLSLGSSPGITDSIDFSLLPASSCPNMSVHFYHTGFTPCFCSWFRVYYRNTGTATAVNAYIDVEFPADVSPVMTCTNGNWSSSYATQWDSQNGNVYTFNLGNVAPGPEYYFYILTETSCSAVMGATKCVTAHIYPDSSCNPVDTAWDRSSVSVDGACIGDSACFTITNTGDSGNGAMQGTSEYRIYENNILVYSGNFQLNGQASAVMCWPANSNTIRLEADQRPGHPGNSHPQASVELCGTPTFVTGQIMLTPEDDEDDFIDMVCLPVTASWDPNDKTVVPEGLTAGHYIDSADNLEYRIRFQNTGTDTAFSVTVRDTISPALDLSTLAPGSGSHQYRMEMQEANIVHFIFDNIMLPDSGANEPQSHGFVNFKIRQKPGNALGTVIENSAGIYFDYNPPVITNTVFNTIGDMDALTTAVPLMFNREYSLKVYPNPFNSHTTFVLAGAGSGGPVSFELYDVLGQKVRAVPTIENNFLVVDRGDLPAGVYIYYLYGSAGTIAAGKLVVN